MSPWFVGSWLMPMRDPAPQSALAPRTAEHGPGVSAAPRSPPSTAIYKRAMDPRWLGHRSGAATARSR
jgi:hypothetical protein